MTNLQQQLLQQVIDISTSWEAEIPTIIEVTEKIKENFPQFKNDLSIFGGYFIMTLSEYDGKYIWLTMEAVCDCLGTKLEDIQENRYGDKVTFTIRVNYIPFTFTFFLTTACVPIEVEETITIKKTLGYHCL